MEHMYTSKVPEKTHQISLIKKEGTSEMCRRVLIIDFFLLFVGLAVFIMFVYGQIHL